MKIWIPGGSGMLATYFIRLFESKNIPYIANDARELDISHEEAVNKFVKGQNITHIVNCAAYTQVDKAESEQELAFLVNATGPEILGKAAARHHLKIIHFSTDYVFDGKKREPYREDDICSPISVYGQSKWEGENRLLAANPDACIIRTSWLYGYPGRNFVETMIRLMQEKEVLRVVKDQVGRPTYCQDLVEAVFQMLNVSGIYHFANSQQTSWHEFAKEIYLQIQSLGYSLKVKQIEPIATHEYKTLAKRPAYSTLSTLKISKILGSEPRPWRDALRDYLSIPKHTQLEKEVSNESSS